MSFLQLVRREMEGSLGRLVFVSAMGGLSTTAIIGAINAGAGAADKGEISLWAAGFFVAAPAAGRTSSPAGRSATRVHHAWHRE